MKIAIDAVGIRGHGGAAVLCELLHWLPKVRPDWRWHVFLFERSLREFDDPQVPESVRLEYTKIGNTPISRLLWINFALQKRVRQIGADVIFAFANIGSYKPSVPQVVFIQQTNAFFDTALLNRNILLRFRLNIMRRLILCGAKISRAVIVQTASMQERVLHYASELNGRIIIIPSGYRTSTSNPLINPEIKLLIEKSGRPRLSYISMPWVHKNHLNLIRAFSIILKTYPKATLILTEGRKNSETPHFIKKLIKDLKNEAQSLGISNNILWFEWLNNHEVNYIYRMSDIMIFPSFTESFGLPLVEAMKEGCPVLAADLPYAHDVCDGAAIYFNPYHPEDLAKSIVSALSSPQILRNLSKLGKERSGRFSYEKIANEIAAVIEKVKYPQNYLRYTNQKNTPIIS